MSQYNSSNLQPLTNRPIVTNKLIFASDHEAWRNDIEAKVAALNDAFQALASRQAGATAPANRAGELWFDTGNSKWWGDPDGAGFDDDIASRLVAKGIGFATAGTGTIKPMGVFHRNTTVESISGPPPSAMISYTLPANTIDVELKLIQILIWGTKTNANGHITLTPRFGSSGVSIRMLNTSTAWNLTWTIIRTASTSGLESTIFRESQDNNIFAQKSNSGFVTQPVWGGDTIIDLAVSQIDNNDIFSVEGYIICVMN